MAGSSPEVNFRMVISASSNMPVRTQTAGMNENARSLRSYLSPDSHLSFAILKQLAFAAAVKFVPLACSKSDRNFLLSLSLQNAARCPGQSFTYSWRKSLWRQSSPAKLLSQQRPWLTGLQM